MGRKRHLLVDTLGLILEVAVTSAAVRDRDGARSVLGSLRQNWSRLTQVWADGGYAGELVNWVWGLRPQRRVHLDIVKRNELRGGFHVLPKCWCRVCARFQSRSINGSQPTMRVTSIS